MKKLILFLTCLMAGFSIFSQTTSNIQQSLSVNGTGDAPDPSAQLDVSSTTKGMLVPRMISAQRTAIASPATGLLVFDTTTGGFWFYNGVVWQNLSTQTVLADADGDTKIQVEESPNEDIIRFDLGGTEHLVLRKNAGGSPRLELPNSLDNTFVGFNSGNANTTGSDNTASGRAALFSNTTGSSNTALGRQALQDNTTGFSNTALGTHALNNNTTSSNLVAVGDSALFNNGIGVSGSFQARFNTAVGSKALYSNTTGFHNTANGYQVLFSNTSGSANVANGSIALFSNTTGFQNTANGRSALFSNTGGADNTATGSFSLFSNTTGSTNTANGGTSLHSNTTGNSNTANGKLALASNTTGDYNSAMGYFADVSSGNHVNATAIGAFAKVGASNCLVLGSIDGVNSATASVNVGIGTTTPDVRLQVDGGTDVALAGGGFIQTGTSAGLNISMDNNEIMARNNGETSTLFLNNDGGDVIIGENGGDVGIGRSPATYDLEVNGSASKSSAGEWLANSDARLKKNIQPLNSQLMLQSLLALRGVTYEWNDDQTGSARPEGIQYGFTAQNIREVFPTLVEEDKLGFLQTAYGTYDAMTVEAIRALHLEIENSLSRELGRELRIENLEKENAALKAELESEKASNAARLDKISAALQGAGIAVEK